MNPAPPVTSARCVHGCPAASTRHRSGADRGAEVPIDELVHLADAAGRVDAHAKRCPALEALGIPGTERAQLVDHPPLPAAGRLGRGARGAWRDMPEAGILTDALLEQQSEVVAKELPAVGRRDRGRRLAARQRAGLRQYPRVAQHAAAHQHAADARPQPLRDLLGFHAVPAPEHRDVQIIGDARHQIPVGQPGVGLFRRPAVNRHRRGARVLHAARQVRSVAGRVVPARAHLHRDGNPNGAGHGGDDARRVLRLAHQAAARVVLGDLADGAPHVHVHDVGAHAFDHLRGRGHLLGIAAEDLDRNRALLLGVLGVLERAVDAAHEALGRHHLGDNEPAPALAFHQAAKRGVGHAGHGGDDERGRKLDAADPRGLRASGFRLPAPDFRVRSCAHVSTVEHLRRLPQR